MDVTATLCSPGHFDVLHFIHSRAAGLQLVTKLRMTGRGRAQVEWRLRGSILVFPIDADFVTDFELDLITGRIFSHSERWDLKR